jgi:penicillin amidase
MRKLKAILVLVFTTIFILLLDRPLGSLPALGRLLDPINGCWANAEAVKKDFNLKIGLPALHKPVSVWMDERMVPHIYAADDHDLYYVQGYVHAYFRLWQMDMQTRAAAGRVSEVIGEKGLNFDRMQRRKGMVYGAEHSLRAMQAEPRTKLMLDAYSEGINQYISSLSYRDLPLEYKLMGFKPEAWTNLKSALLLKYMADDLTGKTEDIPLTVIRDMMDEQEFNYLFPEKINTSTPVIPVNTTHTTPSLATLPPPGDSVARIHLKANDFEKIYDEGKGSNNWALSGSKTKSGAAILCNDPHLGLNLPSLWFEVQLHAPGVNVYGASLPGAPGVVIGFNDNISWGFTNNYRDVKDFYAIKEVGDKYEFDGKQISFDSRVEKIGIKGKADYLDTVRYTVHGPVIYEEKFHGPGGIRIPLALRWMAHDESNELLSLYLLNRSANYEQFVAAIHQFKCPGQNMIYADRQGNIGLWGQGQFVNKWKDQGKYIMSGADSSTLWKELIPMADNPHAYNPSLGYLSSANQAVTDSTYPYWYNGYFYEFRAWRINNVLGGMQNATVQDMFALQNDCYSILAASVLPIMLQYLPANLGANENAYLDDLKGWDYKLTAESKAASVFQLWWAEAYANIWKRRFAGIPDGLRPSAERTMQLMQNDAAHMPELGEAIVHGFEKAVDSLEKLSKTGTEWYHVKNTTVKHLTKLPAFSFGDLKMGGWGNVVNAVKGDHGPSWRMVVEMGREIEAYGVYPGGQSGNPGSQYYVSFLDHWVEGKYYRLQFYPSTVSAAPSTVKYTWQIQP